VTPKRYSKAELYGHVYLPEKGDAAEQAQFIHGIFKVVAEDLRHKNSPDDKPVKLLVTIQLAEE
jgi:hypothetical protein